MKKQIHWEHVSLAATRSFIAISSLATSFLQKTMSARVGDFGISSILPGSACKTLPNLNSKLE
uniref:Uncharacterized protein n=1 Tax=Arundo donax TaxID=35708 RepID=A0A0A9AGE4_ARUDO